MVVKALVVLFLVATGAALRFGGQDEAPSGKSPIEREATAPAPREELPESEQARPEFELLEFRLAADFGWEYFGGERRRRTVGRADTVAYALVDIGSVRAKGLGRQAEPGEAVFELVSDKGSRQHIEALPYQTSGAANIVRLCFYPGTGGEFVAPTLTATIDGVKVAEWRLPTYPTDRRVIPAHEPLVTEVKGVADLDIKVTAEASAYASPNSRDTGWLNLGIEVGGRFDPACEYWVRYEVPETTWREETSIQGSGFLVSEPRTTGSMQPTEYAAFADRMRVTGRIEKTMIYTEPAEFRGLEVVKGTQSDQVRIVNRREQRVVLSTGVEVVLPAFDNPSWIADDGVSLQLQIEVRFPGGTKDVAARDLPGLPKSIDGVTVSIGKTLGNGVWHGAGGSGGGMAWSTGFRADRSTVIPGTSFDLSLDIKHIVTVAKEEFRLLIPIVQLERTGPPAAAVDQEFKDRFRKAGGFGGSGRGANR